MEGERKEGGEFRREMEKEVMEGVLGGKIRERKEAEWEHKDFGNVEKEEGGGVGGCRGKGKAG